MNYKDEYGKIIYENNSQDKILSFLYGNTIGRILIKLLITPVVSKFIGIIMNSKISKPMIYYKIKRNNINLDDYVQCQYTSFNNFFTRQIIKEKRPLPEDNNCIISPADGRISVFSINNSNSFLIKNTYYTIPQLLKNNKLAQKYKDGYVVLIRLTVNDYHHYCYVADGTKSKI